MSYRYIENDFRIFHTLDPHPDQQSFKMHAHDSVEIYLFLSGNCKYLVEGNEYMLMPHDILIMRPSETHMLCLLGDMPYERIVVNLSVKKLKEFDKSGVLTKPFFERPLGRFNQYREEDFGSSYYRMCLESLSENTPLGMKYEAEAKIPALLCEIYKAYENRRENETQAVENKDISGQLIEYINRNLYEPLSLGMLSDKFFLSQSQLNRIFKKSTGTSIWEYVTIKRLISARNRIRNGEHAGNVCTSCGFNDYSSFYRMYKARFGVSPKQDNMAK